MTDRLAHVEARIATVRKLSSVVAAMRGIAAARSHDAQRRLAAIHAYAGAIAGGIAQALAAAPVGAPRASDGPKTHAIVMLCAEQGFAGPFSDRVFDALDAMPPDPGGRMILLIGDRGAAPARERGVVPDWTAAMMSDPDQTDALAGRIIDALFAAMGDGRIDRVTLLGAAPTGLGAPEPVGPRALVPFDYARFSAAKGAEPPLMTLPPARLLEQLAQEYIFAEICEALTLSFAAENEARMRAMIAAHSNVEQTLNDLQTQSRQVRQQSITEEIIELAAGAEAAGP
jgi:F-type H+-transporting ATPase subunit gamma